MKRFPFKKIDAFAAEGSAGNPAGAVYLESLEDITEAEMQRIAWELKGFVSEVGFVAPREVGGFGIRYFSSEREVPFCGHATVGIMYDLIKGDESLRGVKRLDLVTRVGTLFVENRIPGEDAVFICAPEPRASGMSISPEEAAEALGTEPGALDGKAGLTILNAGLETLLAPLTRLEDVLSLAPDMERLKRFCLERGIDIVTVFTAQAADSANAWRTRVFAPVFGYLEDPATGTGNAALGNRLLREGRWEGSVISIEQNNSPGHPNIVKLATLIDDDGVSRVAFGGGAVVRIRGEYILH